MVALSVWEARSDGVELLDITVGEMLDRQAGATPDAPAIIYDDRESGIVVNWSYDELRRRVDDLAASLIGWGVKKGDHVALMSPNAPEWVLLEYALAKVGAVLVTVNPAFKLGELRYLLTQGRISSLLCVASYRGYDIAAALTELMPDLNALAAGAERSGDALPLLKRVCRLGEGTIPGAIAYDDLLALGRNVSREMVRVRQAEVSPQDNFQIQYTSGTTGAPKGAMIRHFSAVNNARLTSQRGGFASSDRLVSPMPYFHTAGSICNVLGMLAVGGCHVGMPAFEAGAALRLLSDHKGTIFNGAPTMFVRMLESPEWTEGRADLSPLRILYTGGTVISPDLMRKLKVTWGAEPMVIMGMTECSPIITQTNPEDDFDIKVTTAGTPLPHTEVMVVDPETEQPVPIGQKGELRIRGYLVTKGYFDMPDKTRDAITEEGWLKSGDLAVMHEGGYVEIVGRLKDMLIRGGENIYPAELEEFLQKHPAVSEAQVVGAPDRDLGEEVAAYIIAKPGAQVTAQEIKDYCRANLARHKLPRYVEFVDAFPLTPSGKIQKFKLRDLAADMAKKEGRA